MRKAKELRRRLLVGMLAITLALGIFGAGAWTCSFTSYAAGQATVTAPNGAKIRQEATTTSNTVGGAEKGKVLSVLSEVQGSDGYTWYQVQVNETTTGYIRSDLVEVTGDVPAAGGEGAEGGGNAPSVEVVEVNPVGAGISDGLAELRDTASTGQVLATVPQNTEITVTGYVDVEDGRWYQTSYIMEGSEMNGFIHSDHVLLYGDLTPPGQEPPQEDDSSTAPTNKPRYEVVEKDGDWLLVDNEENAGYGYSIKGLFEGITRNKGLYEKSESMVKNQKIIIIVLVFLLVGAVAGIAFLVFKIRDMSDSAYFNEVENETLRRRNASEGQGKQKASMHTVGAEKQQARPAEGAKGQRPGASQGARPSGGMQGQRTGAPQGPRPAGGMQGQRTGAPQGPRPSGGMQGQRSGASQGPRPTGGMQGQRPGAQGPRPAGGMQGQRPLGTSQGPRRPEGAGGQAPQGARPGQPSQGNPQKAQPKNFMADDDEFEFEFLNYDEDDQQ